MAFFLIIQSVKSKIINGEKRHEHSTVMNETVSSKFFNNCK